MDHEILIALGDYLNQILRLDTCNNTLEHSFDWLQTHHREDRDAILGWIQLQGVTCDCQVVMQIYLPAREKAANAAKQGD